MDSSAAALTDVIAREEAAEAGPVSASVEPTLDPARARATLCRLTSWATAVAVRMKRASSRPPEHGALSADQPHPAVGCLVGGSGGSRHERHAAAVALEHPHRVGEAIAPVHQEVRPQRTHQLYVVARHRHHVAGPT